MTTDQPSTNNQAPNPLPQTLPIGTLAGYNGGNHYRAIGEWALHPDGHSYQGPYIGIGSGERFDCGNFEVSDIRWPSVPSPAKPVFEVGMRVRRTHPDDNERGSVGKILFPSGALNTWVVELDGGARRNWCEQVMEPLEPEGAKPVDESAEPSPLPLLLPRGLHIGRGEILSDRARLKPGTRLYECPRVNTTSDKDASAVNWAHWRELVSKCDHEFALIALTNNACRKCGVAHSPAGVGSGSTARGKEGIPSRAAAAADGAQDALRHWPSVGDDEIAALRSELVLARAVCEAAKLVTARLVRDVYPMRPVNGPVTESAMLALLNALDAYKAHQAYSEKKT